MKVMAHRSQRKTSAQTRVKLSQAAKKRKRGLKGTSLGGKFMKGASQAHPHLRPMAISDFSEDYPKNKSMGRISDQDWKKFGQSAHQANMGHNPSGKSRQADEPIPPRVAAALSRAEVHATIQRAKNDPQAALKLENELLRKRVSQTSGIAMEDLKPSDMGLVPMRVTSLDIADARRNVRGATWSKDKGVYGDTPLPKGGYTSTGKFIKNMPESHRQWLLGQLSDPKSPFNAGLVAGSTKRAHVKSAGAGRRLDTYVQRLQDGMSNTEAIEYLKQEHRGNPSAQAAKKITWAGQKADQLSQERGKARGRKSAYESFVPKADDFGPAIQQRNVSSIGEIKARFPGLSPESYADIQQAQRRTIFDEISENTKWAHETKAAAYSNADEKRGPNRVTFFATNFGGPVPSVPSDSLVGQYVIKRRKNMLLKDKLATPKELEGRFPRAVRDMHLVEASTGLSGGLEGRYGVFSKTGWRAGSKKSKNYGKPRPVGASVMYDSSGRPMYNHKGDLVYTEGLTRPFKMESMKDVGLRIFVG